ncbi:MAG: hypothetical protein ABJZ55_13770 [Fuerstiella sp.]
MPNFVVREPSDIERWISIYEWFVESVRVGYDMCIYEYTNDLSCRDQLERHRDDPDARAVWWRVVAADAAFRELLIPKKCSIHGDAPPKHFWFWGYPDGSPELHADLKSMDAL